MKTLAILLILSGLFLAAMATQSAEPKANLAFAAKEFTVQAAGVAELPDITGSADFGASARVNYALTRGLLIGGTVTAYDSSHTAIDQFGPRLTLRAPLWDTIAPYGYLDGTYHIGRDAWGAGAGGGIELRPFHKKTGFLQKLSAFGEAGLALETTGRGAVNFAAGVGLSF